MNRAPIATLVAAWQAAKAAEKAANQQRLEIEEQIVAALPPTQLECTVSEKLDGVRVSVSYGINRKVDTEKLREIWDRLPVAAQHAFRWKAEPDMKKLRAIRELLPDAYAAAAAVIEAKPAKASVTVEAIEQAGAL
jgi:hypothetical protein